MAGPQPFLTKIGGEFSFLDVFPGLILLPFETELDRNCQNNWVKFNLHSLIHRFKNWLIKLGKSIFSIWYHGSPVAHFASTSRNDRSLAGPRKSRCVVVINRLHYVAIARGDEDGTCGCTARPRSLNSRRPASQYFWRIEVGLYF